MGLAPRLVSKANRQKRQMVQKRGGAVRKAGAQPVRMLLCVGQGKRDSPRASQEHPFVDSKLFTEHLKVLHEMLMITGPDEMSHKYIVGTYKGGNKHRNDTKNGSDEISSALISSRNQPVWCFP